MVSALRSVYLVKPEVYNLAYSSSLERGQRTGVDEQFSVVSCWVAVYFESIGLALHALITPLKLSLNYICGISSQSVFGRVVPQALILDSMPCIA